MYELIGKSQSSRISYITINFFAPLFHILHILHLHYFLHFTHGNQLVRQWVTWLLLLERKRLLVGGNCLLLEVQLLCLGLLISLGLLQRLHHCHLEVEEDRFVKRLCFSFEVLEKLPTDHLFWVVQLLFFLLELGLQIWRLFDEL